MRDGTRSHIARDSGLCPEAVPRVEIRATAALHTSVTLAILGSFHAQAELRSDFASPTELAISAAEASAHEAAPSSRPRP